MGEGDRGAGGKQAEGSKSDTPDSHTRGYRPRDLGLANRYEPRAAKLGKIGIEKSQKPVKNLEWERTRG